MKGVQSVNERWMRGGNEWKKKEKEGGQREFYLTLTALVI